MSKQNDRVPEVTPVVTGEHVGNLSGGEQSSGRVPAGPRTGAQAQIPTGRVIDETR